MANILVVEDEKNIREMIIKYAEYEGYKTFSAENGKEAILVYKNNPIDVIVLDVMMPEMDGYETLKKLKEINKDVHCIFLTALSQEYDKLYGFDLGAEDYVTKPFSLKELMKRINVILKRYETQTEKIEIEGLVIDEAAHLVMVDGNRVDMPNKEYELLLYLIKNRGNALTRESIITKIWGYYYESDERTLDTHMKLLRKDLGKYANLITTIRGVGYRFEKEA